jgi:hypothetical protein
MLAVVHNDRHAESERRLGERDDVADHLVSADVSDQLDHADLVMAIKCYRCT